MKDIKSPSSSKTNTNGLGIFALAAIVVSSMIGGGIYSLPQNMAAGASAGASSFLMSASASSAALICS